MMTTEKLGMKSPAHVCQQMKWLDPDPLSVDLEQGSPASVELGLIGGGV